MSYIPDYRSEKNLEKLTVDDLRWWKGYATAMEDARNTLDTAIENTFLEDVVEGLKEEFENLVDSAEIDTLCSIFEDGIYEEVELEDVNPKLYHTDEK